MQIISPEHYPQRDGKALLAFLTQCHARAQAQGRPVLASITLAVAHIDPLAVLQAIYEEGELHFYLENAQADEAVAGAEAVLSATFEGEERFSQVQAFIDAALADAVAIGDTAAPFSGPHFFCGFTFGAQADGGPFAPATVFVPRWQVARHAAGYTAVANILVDARTDLRAEAARVLGAHAKFSRFDYGAATTDAAAAGTMAAGDTVADAGAVTPPGEVPAKSVVPAAFAAVPACGGTAAPGAVASASATPAPVAAAGKRTLVRSEVGGDGHYVNAVSEALRRIAAGKYEKIVLARMLDLEAVQPLNPLTSLNRLRERYPSCYAFSFANGRGQSFVGSTPERLLRADGQTLHTEALAGSAPRGQSAAEDAALGAALLANDKDQREHALVRESILQKLGSLGIAAQPAASPRLRRLANLQHLWTPLAATLPPARSLLEIASVLHPTPAVGGVPQSAACADVPELEAAPRGLFTGVLGWVDARGNGEMVVALRSGLIDGNRARLYAGAGIVEGSDPQSEHEETALKMRPLLNAL